MNMFRSIFKSVIHRRDVALFYAFAGLPILVPILSKFLVGVKAEYTDNFLDFLGAALATQDGIVLPVLLLSLIISAVFRDEIDSGILFLYKDLNRTRLFNAKIISLVVMYASYVLLTVLTSAIAYFGFLNASGKVVSDDWSNVQSTFLSIFATISINVIGILLVAMVSIKAKSLQAVLAGVFWSLFTTTAPLLIGVRYVVPNGYAKTSLDQPLLAWSLVVAITTFYTVATYLKGRSNFEKLEF
ncbi:TPA: amino acid transporter [Streptococcus suis]|nr:amino acid transporter [Streptococcus suis]